MDFSPPRGTADLLPPSAGEMLELERSAHELARLHGFAYVETPAFEQTDLFSRTSGESSDIVTKEMYTFEDKGGRSLTLRPEGTAPVVRAYLARAQELGSPFKAYYLLPMWRHSRPQAGRLREFRQFGIEVIGSGSPAADVEVMSVANQYLTACGLKQVSLLYNSIGDEVCRPAYREELRAYLEPHAGGLDEDCRKRLATNPMRVLDCKVDGEKDFVLAAPKISDRLCPGCAEHLRAVETGLAAEGIAGELASHLVRGLDYYTKTAFEFVAGSLPPGQATVCGGGRYDGLAELLGGQPTPGIGFGLGLERTLLAMHEEGAAGPGFARTEPSVFVVTLGDEARRSGVDLVKWLRTAGIAAMSSYEERPLKAQLRMADRAGVTYAAIIGEREATDEVATLRRLSDGEQQAVALNEVSVWVIERR